MSRAYIVTRNGGTVTKAPINDNKIPIYDNESALDADLANIPDNTLVATKEGKFDVDDMKQYIRKQNVLSDWESITISTDVNNPTVIKYDGFITARLATQSGNIGTLYINGTAFSMIASAYAEHYRFNLPVNQNDEVYYVPNGSTLADSFGAFYKLRDYTDR